MQWDDRPRSVKQLYKRMQAQAAPLGNRERRVFMQAVHNAILAQFLPDGAYLKEGAALELAYPLREGRTSEDVDTVYADSADLFEEALRTALTDGWQGFGGEVERLPRRAFTLMPEGSGMTRLRVRLTYLEAPFAKYYLEAVPDLTGAVRERRMNAEAQALIEGLGFRIHAARDDGCRHPARREAARRLASGQDARA